MSDILKASLIGAEKSAVAMFVVAGTCQPELDRDRRHSFIEYAHTQCKANR